MFQADVFDTGHYGLYQEPRPTPLREAVPELPRREAPHAVKPPKPSVAKREVVPTEATVEETENEAVFVAKLHEQLAVWQRRARVATCTL